MQVQSINNQNKNFNFNGLYEIPTKNISEAVSSLIKKHSGLIIPSSNSAHECLYVLTPGAKEVEEEFEKAFLEYPGRYWKSLLQLCLDGQVCEQIFDRTKLIAGEENWVTVETKRISDLVNTKS